MPEIDIHALAERDAVRQLRGSGAEVNVHVTWEGGDAARHAQLAVASGPAVVVAAGGDGTVNEVLNGRQAGGGALLTPRACINDGLFDVMLVPHHDKNRIGHLLSDLLQLKHVESEHFRYFRTSSLQVESEQTLQFNLDGEPLRGTAFDFSVVPLAIDFVFPDPSPLLGAAQGDGCPLSDPIRTTA